MNKAVRTRAVVALACTAALAGGLTACGGGEKAKPKSAAEMISVAYQKTAAAKSAKVRMTMTMPASMKDGGTMEMSGVQGWDPAVMDLTVKGSALGSTPGAPESMRMIMQDQVMYMDLGAKAASEMEGKRWMKLDLQAAAKEAGPEGQAALKQMNGLDGGMNQDPAQQLALLLDSPSLKHVGPEKVDGVEAEHYKGSLTFEEMLKANESAKLLKEADREKLVESMKKAGVQGYDTEVWVNEAGYPVRMKVAVKTAEGAMNMDAHYSDYGAAAKVQLPAEKDTLDLFKMLKDMGAGAKGGTA
ncbi:hypothetical protein [Streptomyces sp. NPDC097619]|uniref:hypothetical protein n=1 Tax=Streptomyces sp. NPDC097619 TaxID=3157228 RepID=UPI00331CACFF